MSENINTAEFWDNYYSKGFYQDSNPEQFNLLYKPFIDEVFNTRIVNNFIIEIGCGLGKVVNYLAGKNSGWFLRGFDISPKAIHESIKRFKHDNLKFEVCDFFDRMNAFKNVDTIIAFEILEHFEEVEKELRLIFKCLDDDGMLLFSVPKENGINDENDFHYSKWDYESTTQRMFDVGFKKVEFHSNIMNHNQIIGVAYK